MAKKGDSRRSPQGATATGTVARRIQRTQDARDAAGKGTKKSGAAVQAGARREPARLPAQHQAKPGDESGLALAPQFLAPDYRGSGKLQGFAAIITGGDSGIGRAVAVLFAREGADVTVAYLDEHRDARETKARVEAEGRRCLLIAGDVKDSSFCDRAVAKAVRTFGRLDVLVNNAAYQQHADSIADITDERLDLTLRTNIHGYFHMARASLPHMKERAAII